MGASVNVRINFSWMKNGEYIEKTEKQLNEILEEIGEIKAEALSYTLRELGV